MMKKWLLIVSLVVNIILIVAFVVGGTMLRRHLWRMQADIGDLGSALELVLNQGSGWVLQGQQNSVSDGREE